MDYNFQIDKPQDAIEQLCKLQAEVASKVYEYKHAADCFCGERQSWVEKGTWQNEGEIIEYIVKAVHKKMERDKAAK